MKRIVLFLICLLIFPIGVHAASSSELKISGNNSVKIGEEITINISASVSNYKTTEGIQLAAFELIYDNKLLALTDYYASGYDSFYTTENDTLVMISQAIEGSGPNSCVSGLLQCGTYNIELKFIALSTDKDVSTQIKINEFSIGIFDITENREYTFDDLIELSYTSKTHNITVSPLSVTPKSTAKSNNNNLKSIEITDHEIIFDKNKTEYDVVLKDGVDKLNFKLATEHAKATYKIIGNEHLKKGSLIIIKVTAEDETIKTYTINLIKDEPKKDDTSKNNESKVVVKDDSKIDDDNLSNYVKIALKYGGIALGIIAGIFVIVSIVNAIRNRKIEKQLDELDKM